MRATSRAVGISQPKGQVARPARVTARVVTARMAVDDSSAEMRRVTTSRSAPKTAAPSGRRATQPRPSPAGRMITKTPRKPTMTASQRRQPTFSPRKTMASRVMKSGPAKAIA